MDLLDRVTTNALLALVPPPRLRLSEWLEREFHLPDTSSQPGRMQLWQYQKEIADCITDPTIERISVVKPTRIGYTQLLVGAIAAYVANEPSPILCLLPTESDCRDFVVSDIEPSFSATPSLRNALSPDRIDADRDTVLAVASPAARSKSLLAKHRETCDDTRRASCFVTRSMPMKLALRAIPSASPSAGR